MALHRIHGHRQHRGDLRRIQVFLESQHHHRARIGRQFPQQPAQPTLTVRYFPNRSKQPAEDTPTDPAPLEEAADALLAFFDRASQAPGFFTTNLSCRLTTLRPDYRPTAWRVEGTLLAYTLGAAA